MKIVKWIIAILMFGSTSVANSIVCENLVKNYDETKLQKTLDVLVANKCFEQALKITEKNGLQCLIGESTQDKEIITRLSCFGFDLRSLKINKPEAARGKNENCETIDPEKFSQDSLKEMFDCPKNSDCKLKLFGSDSVFGAMLRGKGQKMQNFGVAGRLNGPSEKGEELVIFVGARRGDFPRIPGTITNNGILDEIGPSVLVKFSQPF